MPSPLGHSLLGVCLAVWVGFRALIGPGLLEGVRTRWKWFVAALVLANLPDIDYIPGLFYGDWNLFHHDYTHTAGWCLLVSAGGSLLLHAFRPGTPFSWHLLLWVAPLSHILLDVCSEDHSTPRGVMLLWPMTEARFILPHPLFLNLEKNSIGEIFQWHNVKALLLEMMWLGPPAMLSLFLFCRAGGSLRPGSRQNPSGREPQKAGQNDHG